jgi:WD40 repeat protein
VDTDITRLAKMMRARRAAGVAPYTLLLGSSLSLTQAVRRAVCDSEDWEAFWETVCRTSPAERRALMHEPLSQLDLQAGCDALAQLVGAGYFNVVLTLNVDDALDNALQTLPASEYRVWVHGEVSSREIITALDRPTPRIKVVKLRGDVNAYKLPLTPEASFEFPDDLEDAVTRFLRHDTVIVGDLPFDDDVQRCIRGGDGALWVIAAEGSDFLGRAKRIRKVGEVIAAEFNAFFTALVEALGLGEAEEAVPEMAFIPPEERVNPYRGLEPFEPEHARYFFGREVLTEILVEQLRRGRFLAVLGASGSGKSSVVRAGVLPALAQGKLPGSENWPVLVIKPGQNPQEALAGALAATVSAARSAGAVDFARLQEARQEIQERLLREESALHELVTELALSQVEGMVAKHANDRRVVVVIDQFEELFTLCPFEQRQRFIDALLYAVRQSEGRTTVLLTLRADFVTQCTAYPDLSDLIASHQVWVRAMNDEGLRAAIERPIWLAGMRYEPGLVPLILADVGREPGALPLLEDALWSLFEYCKAGDEVIESREYREIGGVQGALAKRADDAHATLSAEEKEYTRHILLRLVEMREGQETTRRRATLDELVATPEERAPVEKVVQRLTDARLLTTTQDEETGQRVVDISHEVLIRGWPRLREWLEESREDLVTHQRLREAAAEWEREERHESYVYRGARLAKVVEWRAAHERELNESEQAFLDASIREQEVERTAARRRTQRIIAGLVAGLLIISALAIFALGRSQLAEQRRVDAESAKATAQAESTRAINAENTAVAEATRALNAEATADLRRIEAEKAQTIAQSRALAIQAENVKDPELAVLLALEAIYQTHQDAPATVAAEGGHTLYRVIARSRWRTTFNGHTDGVRHAAWNSDDTRILTASWDGTTKVWNAQTGVEFFTLSGHTGGVYHAAWNSDDTRIVTASEDGTAKVWDAQTGVEILTLSGHTDQVRQAAWNSDDTRIVTASEDGTAKVWDAQTGVEILTLSGHTDQVRQAAWNSVGTRIATYSADGTAKVWDAQTGAELFALSGHALWVQHTAWSPDDTRIVTASLDGTAKVWDAQTGAELLTLSGHTDRVWYAAWNSAGTRIATHSADGSIKVWDAQTGVELFTLSGHTGRVSHVAWSSDDTRIVTSGEDGTAKVWDARTNVDLFTLSGHTHHISQAAWDSTNTRILTASWDGTAKVWDAQTGVELLTLSGHTGELSHAAWSSDDTRILTASWDGTARVWDAQTGAELLTLSGHTGSVLHAAWSTDDTRIVTTGWDGAAKVWDVQTGAELLTLSEHTSQAYYAAWNSTGTRIVTINLDDTAKVWDAQTGAELFTLGEHTGSVSHVAWNSDDTRIVTASEDGTAKVWDAQTGVELFTLSGHTDKVWHAAWSSDDTRIVTASEDGTAKVWDAQNGVELFTLSGHTDQVRHAAWNSDDTRIVTASWDGTAKVWDAQNGAELLTLSGHTDKVWQAAWSSDDTRIVTASSDGSARIYFARLDGPGGLLEFACTRTERNLRLDEWRQYVGDEPYRKTCPDLPGPPPVLEPIVALDHGDKVWDLAFSPNGTQLASASYDGTVLLWDPMTGDEPALLIGHEGMVIDVAFSPDGTQLATASGLDHTARLWDLRTLNEIAVLSAKGGVAAVNWSPDGKRLVTGDAGGAVIIWDGATGEALTTLKSHEGVVYAAVFSPDGKKLVSVGEDGTARLWDAETGAELAMMLGHEGAVFAVAFSPDGERLVTAGEDSTVRLWDANTGDELAVLQGHTRPIQYVVFNLGGDKVVTAGVDGKARVWDAITGAAQVSLVGHSDAVMHADFGPDGEWIITAGADGTARLWDADSGEMLAILGGATEPIYRAVFSPDGTIAATAGADGLVRVYSMTIED